MPQITSLPNVLFYSFLTLIFLFEGLGWRGGREATFTLILIMPIFLFTLDFILKRKIYIPKIPSILYGGFIFFSYISTIYSVDQSRSIPYLLYYLSLYFIFLYVYNHQSELTKYLIPFIFCISFIFSLYSLAATYLVNINPDFFYPENGAQYIIARYGSHNSLGDLLIIPVLICVYYILIFKNNKLFILSLLYFFPFFLLSFSRSAYLSLSFGIIVLFIYLFKKHIAYLKLKSVLLIGGLLSIMGLLFFITTVEFGKLHLFRTSYSYLVNNFQLQQKSFLANRQFLYYEGLVSIIDNPLLGVGPNNYLLISQKSPLVPFANTDSSHNLFIDIFSENGIIAGIFFLFFIMLSLTKGRRNIYYLLLFIMLINFQTMYTFRIYSFFLLFFILLSYTYEGRSLDK